MAGEVLTVLPCCFPEPSGELMATYGYSPDYNRNYNEDEGTIDSVCTHCRKTIARGREERKISLLEEIHLCIPKLAATGQLVTNTIPLDPREQWHML
jgi:hypothetical protein